MIRERIEDHPMAEARTCYDHPSGRVGVGIYEVLVDAEPAAPPRSETPELLAGYLAKTEMGGYPDGGRRP